MPELWIARDMEGALYLYKEEPIRYRTHFLSKDSNVRYDYIALDDSLFPEVTWENSPRKVKIELV